MRIPKRFKGHAAHHLRALIKLYKPPTKVEVMKHIYDPADDGPEIDVIKFFQWHKQGSPAGTSRCCHIAARFADFGPRV